MRNFKTANIVSLALTLLIISSQTSAAKMLDGHTGSIMSGEKGAIVLSVDDRNPACASGELKFINVQTGKRVTGRFSNSKNIFSGGKSANIVAVRPGQYQLVGGHCMSKSSSAKAVQPLGRLLRNSAASKAVQPLNHLSAQYGSIFVGAGEVVYPGTFVFPQIQRGQRVPYNLYGKPAVIVQKLRQRSPALVTRFVERPVAFHPAVR